MARRKHHAINGVTPKTQPAPTQMTDLPPEDRAEPTSTELPKPETDTRGDDWFDIDDWG